MGNREYSRLLEILKRSKKAKALFLSFSRSGVNIFYDAWQDKIIIRDDDNDIEEIYKV